MTVREGDWVRVTKDAGGVLGGVKVRAGTKGVVTGDPYGWVDPVAAVRFDGGFGTVSVTVPTRHLRRVRRGGGVDAFVARQSRLALVRAALALFLAWPVVSFVARYVFMHHSFKGLTEVFAIGALQSVGDWVAMLLSDPVHTLVYLGFLAALGRFAWR